MANIDEFYLVKKLKEGDIYALEVIYKQHYTNLCRYLSLLFKNQVPVEQIADDIFIYIWEHRESLEIKTSLESYLYAAGKYKALNKIRDTRRREEIYKDFSTGQSNITNSSELILEFKELDGIIEKAIEKLPERCQHIFRLSREEDLSYAEIARLLNISIHTVENQMSIAIKASLFEYTGGICKGMDCNPVKGWGTP
jgi:RNA polymerase sigma-70 factor (family 1)